MLEYSNEKPTEPGLYLWKEEENGRPFHILASVRIKDGVVYVNLLLDVDQFKFDPMDETADRWWCKVA